MENQFAPFRTKEEKDTAQELFNTAVIGVYKQGRVSSKKRDNGASSMCAYRGADGCKCAIGFLIDDDTAARWDSHGSLDTVRYAETDRGNYPWLQYSDEYFGEASNDEPPLFELMQEVQHNHDTHMDSAYKTTEEFRSAFWIMCEITANSFNLTMPDKQEVETCSPSSSD